MEFKVFAKSQLSSPQPLPRSAPIAGVRKVKSPNKVRLTSKGAKPRGVASLKTSSNKLSIFSKEKVSQKFTLRRAQKVRSHKVSLPKYLKIFLILPLKVEQC